MEKQGIFFYLRESDFLVIKYRFSHDRYQIRVRNFKIRIRRQKLPIHYKIRHLTTKGRFWSNFLVRYLKMLLPFCGSIIKYTVFYKQKNNVFKIERIHFNIYEYDENRGKNVTRIKFKNNKFPSTLAETQALLLRLRT